MLHRIAIASRDPDAGWLLQHCAERARNLGMRELAGLSSLAVAEAALVAVGPSLAGDCSMIGMFSYQMSFFFFL